MKEDVYSGKKALAGVSSYLFSEASQSSDTTKRIGFPFFFFFYKTKKKAAKGTGELERKLSFIYFMIG